MNRYVIIDGAEKVGKSTIIEALRAKYSNVIVRKWSQIKPDDRVYANVLKEEMIPRFYENNYIVVWDRSWASEYVYGELLNRQRRGVSNPWLLEWLHGRAIFGHGRRYIVHPQNIADSIMRRDNTDLPVNPHEEVAAFYNYASFYGWERITNDFRPETADSIAAKIKQDIDKVYLSQPGCSPMYYTDPMNYNPDKCTVIIGEKRNPNDHKTLAGAWLPFSSLKMTQWVQRYFGLQAFNFAWTNADDIEKGNVPIGLISGHKIIAFGKRAEALCASLALQPSAAFAHPAYFSRWNTDRGITQLRKFEAEIGQFL